MDVVLPTQVRKAGAMREEIKEELELQRNNIR
jgi:hypothetical protein